MKTVSASLVRTRLKRTCEALVKQAALISLTLVTLFPIYFVVCSAFKSKAEFYTNKLGLPVNPTVENFTVVLMAAGFPRWILNSLIVTVPTTLLGTFIASLGAYALGLMRFKGRKPLYNLMIMLQGVPVIVTIIPLYLMMVRLGLINQYPSAMLVFLGFMVPSSVFFLTNFFRDIPQSLIDAALIDGCSTFRIYWNIVLPLSLPALVTKVVVGAFWVWSDLLIPLVLLQSDEMKTLTAGLILFRSRFVINVPAICAGSLISILPTVLLYVFCQRYFVRGLVAGAVKGEIE